MGAYFETCVDSGAPRKLFCFHHAGGGTSLYRGWQKLLTPEVEVVPVLLPGRERRVREPRFRDLDTLLEDIEPHIEAYADRPYAFFGHSMGALIAYGLALLRQQRGRRMANAVLVSACPAPKVRSELRAAELEDRTLLALLAQVGGQSAELLGRADWPRMMLPVIRDDFLVCSNYRFPRGVLLASPIHVLGASDDKRVDVSELHSWSSLTCQSSAPKVFAGDHFYLRSAPEEVLGHVRGILSLGRESVRPLPPRVPPRRRDGGELIANLGESVHE
jgi:surfactin synthase thioesterase subunit